MVGIPELEWGKHFKKEQTIQCVKLCWWVDQELTTEMNNLDGISDFDSMNLGKKKKKWG